MANWDDQGDLRPVRAGRFVHLAGAATSAALVGGLLWWGYALAVRDVHGIPVVRALEGPMRMAPAAPGGEVTAHQGLAVNQVAANGMAAPLPDRLALAPRPDLLAEEDVAGLLPEVPEAALVTAAAIQPAPSEPVVPAEDATAAAIAAALAEVAADPLANAIIEPPPDTGDLPARAAARPVARPPLPTPLPPTDLAAAPLSAPEAAAPVALAEADPATIPAATPLIQLDAFDSAEDARTAWATLQGRYPDLLADKALLLDVAQSGGVQFYRLRATGLASREDAMALCDQLKAQGATCIPVLHD
jgi:SPOR domain